MSSNPLTLADLGSNRSIQQFLYELPQDVLFSTALYGTIPEALQSDYIVNVMEGIIPEYPWCRHYIIEKYKDMYKYEISQAMRGRALDLDEEQENDIEFLMDPFKSRDVPRTIRFTPSRMIDSPIKELVRECNAPELQGLTQSQILDIVREINPQFNVGEVFSHAREIADIRRSLSNIQDPLLKRIHDLVIEGYITRAYILRDGVSLRLDPRVIDSISSLVTYPLVSAMEANPRGNELSIHIDPNYQIQSMNESDPVQQLKRLLQDTSMSLDGFNLD
uniref:Uncharacterized protein n=1 Tax=viral metagenome TaxID=1070528 RepID=A0A6C0BKE6_9ZZZZ